MFESIVWFRSAAAARAGGSRRRADSHGDCLVILRLRLSTPSGGGGATTEPTEDRATVMDRRLPPPRRPPGQPPVRAAGRPAALPGRNGARSGPAWPRGPESQARWKGAADSRVTGSASAAWLGQGLPTGSQPEAGRPGYRDCPAAASRPSHGPEPAASHWQGAQARPGSDLAVTAAS